MNQNNQDTAEAESVYISGETVPMPDDKKGAEEKPKVELDIPNKFTHRGGEEAVSKAKNQTAEAAYDPKKNLQDRTWKDTTPSPDKPQTLKVPFQERAEGLDSTRRTEP